MLEVLAKKIPFHNLANSSVENLLILLTTLLVGVFIYSRTRRRGNYPPGPIGLPLVGYVPFLGSEPHKTFVKLARKYGDIFSVYLGSKHTIILNEYSVMKETVTHPAALDRAPNIFDHLPLAGFIKANGEEWVEQRRFCLFATRDLGLGRGPWENLIMEEVTAFTKQLESFQGHPTEISHNLSSSISSNIISLLIGRRLDKEREAEKIQISVQHSDVAFTFNGPSNIASVMPWLRKYLEFFKIAGYDRAAKAISKFDSFIKEEVARHKTSLDYRNVHDFINTYREKMSEVLPSEKIKHYFTEENLEGNLNILFLGASDTIFSSLTWLFRLMAKHEDVQEKCYTEIMDVLGKEGVARYSERQKVPYTFAVIMESQRFSSIVPLSTTRLANNDFTIKDYTIPKGAEIVANLWALHNDPKYWKEPEKFIPERFLTNNGSTLVKNPPSYAPFSLGRRNCPGETIAWMEILSYFTEILKKFKISPQPGAKLNFTVINGLVARLEPQSLCFEARSV
ncbi:cytochrome P450 2J4-like [Uloborus diversus]|uniref:cytochrome P450 2J4-like n=1 Tax=Uloborus diversus TaxID=327109 RepID=UPI002408FDE4|nr:cytochrome P450 2J4-like [Uloborus diversus]